MNGIMTQKKAKIAEKSDVGADYLLGLDRSEPGGKRGQEKAILLDAGEFRQADDAKGNGGKRLTTRKRDRKNAPCFPTVAPVAQLDRATDS